MHKHAHEDLPEGRISSIRARGRGAQINPANRFEKLSLTVLGEHLDDLARDGEEDERGAQLATNVYIDTAKTLINKITSPDVGMSWSINPYRGCEHGCAYCYARPTHETFGLSCGLDFETKLFAKIDAPELLRRELAKPKWVGEKIVMSGITDPYQPIEKKFRVTRGCLEVMAECAQPVGIITKNRLVTRDIDLLGPMAAEGCATVAVSITTLDAKLGAIMEPRAASPLARLDTVRKLTDAGVPTIVMVAPIIPGLNDSHLHLVRGGRFYNAELRWDGVPTLAKALGEQPTTAEAFAPVLLPGLWQTAQEHHQIKYAAADRKSVV